MPLPKLSGTNRLPKLSRQYAQQPTLKAQGGQYKLSTAPAPIVIIPPSGSQEEQWIFDYIIKQNPHWVQQVTFGNIRERGSTRADFVNDPLKAVLYPEGIFVHRNRIAKDLVKYAMVRSKGYRVFVYYFTTLDYVKKTFPAYYYSQFG